MVGQQVTTFAPVLSPAGLAGYTGTVSQFFPVRPVNRSDKRAAPTVTAHESRKLQKKGGGSLCKHDGGRQQRSKCNRCKWHAAVLAFGPEGVAIPTPLSATTVSQAKQHIKKPATATAYFAQYAIGLPLLSPEAATAAVDEPSAVPAGDEDSVLAEFFA